MNTEPAPDFARLRAKTLEDFYGPTEPPETTRKRLNAWFTANDPPTSGETPHIDMTGFNDHDQPIPDTTRRLRVHAALIGHRPAFSWPHEPPHGWHGPARCTPTTPAAYDQPGTGAPWWAYGWRSGALYPHPNPRAHTARDPETGVYTVADELTWKPYPYPDTSGYGHINMMWESPSQRLDEQLEREARLLASGRYSYSRPKGWGRTTIHNRAQQIIRNEDT